MNNNTQASSGKSTIIMFTGKGGVGKTTCAATTALHMAYQGKRTLAISTDATPSLSHIFSITDDQQPARVRDRLYINEIGAAEVREMWDWKFGREVYEVFSSFVSIRYADFVEFMTSVLPGLSDEFMVDYIRELSGRGDYDTIIWDTAPLGQTLALLKTPALLGQHLKMAPRIYSRLKVGRASRESVLDILKRWDRLSQANMDFLRNDVRFVVVTIAEALAVEQLDGIFQEMKEYGFKVGQLIINNVVQEEGSRFLVTKAEQQKGYRDHIYHRYPELEIIELPMYPYELKGLDRLTELEADMF